MHRPEEMLRERLPIGPPELFAEKLAAFADAGVQRVYIWPVADELRQLLPESRATRSRFGRRCQGAPERRWFPGLPWLRLPPECLAR